MLHVCAGAEIYGIEPRFYPRCGGVLAIIRGRFEVPGVKYVATIGGVPCTATRRMSACALHCVLPRGSGANLPVEAHVCGCSRRARELLDDDETDGDNSGETTEFKSPTVLFSYTEDLLETAVRGVWDMRSFRSIPTESEGVDDPSHGQCAVVGHSGSLVGGGLASEIDGADAVFRFDGAPSGSAFSKWVGRKTTYQVLGPWWADSLAKHVRDAPVAAAITTVSSNSTNTGIAEDDSEGADDSDEAEDDETDDSPTGDSPFNRWWGDASAVPVLWAEKSASAYEKLQTAYPDTRMIFLSKEAMTSVYASVVKVRKLTAEAVGESWVLPADADELESSLMVAVGLAIKFCKRVTVYGVFGTCSPNKSVCRPRYYLDEETVTHKEKQVDRVNQLSLTAMSQVGYVRVHRFEPDLLSRLNIPDGVEPPVVPASPSMPWTCDWLACQPTCSRRGKVNDEGECICEAPYTGVDCEKGAEAREIMDGLDLDYNGAVTMSQGEVKTSPSGVLYIPIPPVEGGDRPTRYIITPSQLRHLPSTEWRPAFNTCAIVGNSGSLLYEQYGKDIDAHDAVFRFNQAPTLGYEVHVGSRTTFEFLNSAWVQQLLDSTRQRSHGHIASAMPQWDWRQNTTGLILFEMYDMAAWPYRTRAQIEAKEAWWRRAYVRLRTRYSSRHVVSLSPRCVHGYTVHNDVIIVDDQDDNHQQR
eukprot:jgi/Chlat1/5793/Chrsp387S05512